MSLQHFKPASTALPTAWQAFIKQANQTLGWSEAATESDWQSPLAGYYLWTRDQQPVAYIGYQQVLDEVTLNKVYVAPQYRQQGIASQLLAAALDELIHAGAQRVYLEVRASNQAAQALYTKCGFQAVGRRLDYYRQPTEDALLFQWVVPRNQQS